MELTESLIKAREERAEKYCKLVDKFPHLKSESVLSYLRASDYFTAPSSYKRHGAWIGGNFDHSVAVTELILRFTEEEGLKWEREESPYIIGLFHDICKSDQRGFKMKNGNLKIMSLECPDQRHGDRSAELIEANIITLTEEERECVLYHMGVYGGDEEYQQQMAEAMAQNSNIAFVQKADTIAARAGI